MSTIIFLWLRAYGFDNNSVEFFCRYVSNRYQCRKINNSFSQWKKVLAGVHQGSILGPLLFTMFINIFLFLQKCDLADYADDSNMYSSDKNINNIMTTLNHDFAILINAPLCYLALRMNFRQTSYQTFLLKKAKRKKYRGSLLITNLTSPHILLALPKRRIKSSMPLPEYKNLWLQSKTILYYKVSV